MLATKTVKTVTNISKLSLTHFVPNIGHQHRFRRNWPVNALNKILWAVHFFEMSFLKYFWFNSKNHIRHTCYACPPFVHTGLLFAFLIMAFHLENFRNFSCPINIRFSRTKKSEPKEWVKGVPVRISAHGPEFRSEIIWSGAWYGNWSCPLSGLSSGLNPGLVPEISF